MENQQERKMGSKNPNVTPADKIVHYGDPRLPCLCTDVSCDLDDVINYYRLASHPAFRGPAWTMVISERESSYKGFYRQFPHLHKYIYSVVEDYVDRRGGYELPPDGEEAFVGLVGRWFADKNILVTDVILRRLWLLVDRDFRRRICCYAKAAYHGRVERVVRRQLRYVRHLIPYEELQGNTVEEVYARYFTKTIFEEIYNYEGEMGEDTPQWE